MNYISCFDIFRLKNICIEIFSLFKKFYLKLESHAILIWILNITARYNGNEALLCHYNHYGSHQRRHMINIFRYCFVLIFTMWLSIKCCEKCYVILICWLIYDFRQNTQKIPLFIFVLHCQYHVLGIGYHVMIICWEWEIFDGTLNVLHFNVI